jgi:hypothetical protein
VTRVCLVRVKLGIVAIQLSDRDSMHGPIPSHAAVKCERALATLNQINMIINYFTTLVIVHSSKEICKSRGPEPRLALEWLRLCGNIKIVPVFNLLMRKNLLVLFDDAHSSSCAQVCLSCDEGTGFRRHEALGPCLSSALVSGSVQATSTSNTGWQQLEASQNCQ